MKKERNQDLTDPEEEALERHVDEMLSPDPPPPPKPNKIVVKDLAEEVQTTTDQQEVLAEPAGAPVVRGKKAPKEPVSIKITHFGEEDAEASQPKEEPTPQDDNLTQAIEETNQQLAEELLPGSPPVDAKHIDEPNIESDAEEEPAADDASPEVTALSEPNVDTVASEPEPEPEPPVAPRLPKGTKQEKVVPPAERKPPVTIAEVAPLVDTLNDSATNKAVDEIIAEESDKLLEDVAGESQIVEEAEKMSFLSKMRGIFGLWWHSTWARYLTLLLIFGLIGAAAAMPTTRYYVLNMAGVRGSASVSVVDQSTFQPLKNVQIKIADQSAQTDENGKAVLSNIKLGGTQLTVQKYAFAPINKNITIGWGSNPLGSFNLSPVGTQYTVKVTDYLSGKPVAKVQASAGQSDAQSDDKGVIKLTMAPGSTATSLQVNLSVSGYRNEQLTLDLTKNQDTNVKLVPANKAVYVSKRSGTYDVYAKYIDGKDEQKLLAGTGTEQSNIVLTPSPDGQEAALVSTRDNQRNSDGFLLSTLTVIGLASSTTKTVTHAEQIFIVGWTGSRLVYVQTAAGTSAANPNRQRLMSYDYKTGDNHQLASTNYFNDVMIINGKIYYAPSSTYQAAGVAINFFSINPDGSNKQTVLAKETWNAFRVAYDDIVLSVTNQEWYDFKLGSSPSKMSGAPGGLTSRVYVDSPDGSHSVWIDNRDGKGVLLAYDTQAKKDMTLYSQSGLVSPVYWLNNTTAVYRVKDDQETADYAISIEGGSPQKVSDVTNTGGVDKWYYY